MVPEATLIQSKLSPIYLFIHLGEVVGGSTQDLLYGRQVLCYWDNSSSVSRLLFLIIWS